MIVRVLDFSHHQSRRNGDGTYTVVANLQLAKESGCSGVIVRSCYGERVDTTAREHNRRADAAFLPRAFYWYHLSRQSASKQAQVAFNEAGATRGIRGFCDLEENARSDGAEPVYPRFSEQYWNHVNSALMMCDTLTGLMTGVYSSKTWLDNHFTPEQQRRWNTRLGWWAHYPNLPQGAPVPPGVPWVPSGWKGLPIEWCLWQDKIGPWPGFPGEVDYNRVWSGLELEVIFGAGTPASVSIHPVLVGLHGRADGRMQTADFNTVRQGKIEAVKLLTTAAPEDVDMLRAIRGDMFISVRLFADFRNRVITPTDFARDSGMGAFYARGVRHFEIHNEPNLAQEGLSMNGSIGSWRNGTEFGAWFADVRNRLKAQYPEALFGFPGLSPGGDIDGIRMSEQVFMNGAQSSANVADWLGLHVYWNDAAALTDALSGRAAHELAARFSGKPIYITEFSNAQPIAKELKGAQYVQFYKACQSFPNVVAAFSFVVSSSAQFANEVWRDEDGNQTAITSIVGARAATPIVPVREIIRGSKIGIHSFRPNQVLPLVQAAVERGVTWPVVKAIADAGVGQSVKAISPQTITITRFVNLAEDASQDVDKWTAAEMVVHARNTLAFAMGNTARQAQLRAGTDYIEPLNEADPPGINGYAAFGRYLCEVVRQADALGIHLAIPGFNSGTPEYGEMLAMANTGLFGLMKAGGHILSLHEGTVRNNPVDLGFGDRIPGAPVVAGAGSQCCRYRYLAQILRERNELVPMVITEFYASGSYILPPAAQVTRFEWYDRECRKDPYILGILPFTIDAVPGGEWDDQNYTYAYPAVLDYMDREKNLPNATTGDDAMDEPTRLALIDDWKAAQASAAVVTAKATHSLALLASLAPPPVHIWHIGDVALANTNPLVTYVSPNGVIKDKRPATPPGGPMITYDLNVAEVSADGLWLRVAPGMWVKVADVKLKGT